MEVSDLGARLVGAGGSLCPAPRGLVAVRGPEARGFLHRLCSQDIEGMAQGEVRPAAFLDAKGKLLATCEAAALEDGVFLSVQAHLAATLAELLERFHFTEDLTVEGPLGLGCAEVFRPAGEGDGSGCTALDGGGFELRGVRAGIAWTRRHAKTDALDAWVASGPPRLGDGAAAALRFALREPLVGRDSEANTLALELPIADHISTTKGCYTGQEIVARIHTYGHTNRSLCLLRIEGVGEVVPGTALVETEDGDAVGRVMTSAAVPGEAARLAFGFLPNAFSAAGTVVALGSADGPAVTVA